jgi:hypothetical protein
VFQEACVRSINEVLSKHGSPPGDFEMALSGVERLTRAVRIQGKDYVISVSPDHVLMHSADGRSAYECYLKHELSTPESLISGFASRLDRYIGGGSWAGPDEEGLLDRILNKLRRFRTTSG